MTRHGYDALKRGIDVTAAGLGLILTGPLQLVLGCLVRTKLGKPALFRQARPGKDGRVFTLIKFRSMRHPDATQVTDAERLTPFGRALRATSLDELPTLWNVFKGDMSLVGPRPLLLAYLPLYSADQARRHEVRPGITGLAQVSGRNALSWEDRFALDVHYVDHRSLLLDLRILLRTLTKVIAKDGISADGHVTMAPFTGNHAGDSPSERAPGAAG